MGWGSEQITGILGSILGAIGNGISDFGAKIKETADIVGTPDEAGDETKKNNSNKNSNSFDHETNESYQKSSQKTTAQSATNNKRTSTNQTYSSVNSSRNSTDNTSSKVNCSGSSYNSTTANKSNFSWNSTNKSTTNSSNNKKAYGNNISLVFGEPKFSVYDQGIRGISFPYHLSIKNRQSTPITVTAKFCTMDGSWIKSNVDELSDGYGNVFVKESLFVDSMNYEKDSYLFLPYGVLDLKETQQICLNLNVICNRGTGETLLRFSYRFEYYIYKNDPREPKQKSNNNTGDYYTDYFGQPGVEELLGLIAHVIKADSVTSPEEVRTVIEFFNSSPHLDKDKIKTRLKYNLSHLPDIQSCCKALRIHYNTQGLLTFVGLFLNIAISDGKTPYCELKVIEDISNCLKIPPSNFQSLKDSFIPRNRRTNATSFEDFEREFFGKTGNFDYGEEEDTAPGYEGYYDASDHTGSFHKGKFKPSDSSNYYNSSNRTSSKKTTNNNSYSSNSTHNNSSNSSSYSSYSNQRTSTSNYRSTYTSYDNPLWKMFNLPSSATKAELKKAYHEKCKLFHPDKFANAPESKRKEAEELFKNYQAAYEELLREF